MSAAITHSTMANTSVPVHELLTSRWSPRAFDPDHEITTGEAAALLEAARWAPSARNSQPWRFLIGHREDANFALMAEHLGAPNKVWAWRASMLILVLTRQIDDEGKALPWAMYDTGQAMADLTLQAQSQALVVHQMGGFSQVGVRDAFSLDSALTPVVIAAVGRHDPSVTLPEQLEEREQAPRVRLPMEDILLKRLEPVTQVI